MKKLLTFLTCAVLLVGIGTGCKSSKLEQGGAYAPVGTDGAPHIAPDLGFAVAEMSFKLAHQALTTVFDIEYENRQLLWDMSPSIKQSLDNLRIEANAAISLYAHARDTYRANPTPEGLSTLEFALAKVRQLATTAQSVLPNQ
jgi:hypothetical protein